MLPIVRRLVGGNSSRDFLLNCLLEVVSNNRERITNAVFVDESGTEWYTLEADGSHDTEGHVDAVQGAQQGQGKCQKCGSRKHKTFECTTDMSKTRCFRCQGVGHVSMNCPQ